MTKILVTCPPMLRMIDEFRPIFAKAGVEITTPDVVQTLTVPELKELVPQHDGWIIGDDPATREVFEAGKQGRLRAAVKWGIGVDNVDFAACKDLGIPIINTPNMFGAEVADVAMCYVLALARETFLIDRGHVVAVATRDIQIDKSGFERTIYLASRRDRFAYGLACVVMSLGLGWAAAMAFRRRF